ncbi:unnamed protein product [Ranitomeya imitator]|uniref:Uncharacterized protein n=1 Tax=Ranitomeya imitator TaxID=111125 RepID=A0ABN9L3R0_9NEOB|nr:unnamed protein product [Ranitomeya imitator]
MFTLVTGIVGRWKAVCVTALQRPNSDAAAIDIVVGIAAASLSVKLYLCFVVDLIHFSKEDEEFLASSISPVTPMATTEVESTTVISTVTSVSRVSVDIPPTRRITTTASDGLDRLESEAFVQFACSMFPPAMQTCQSEGDEEDEDEEDEDDDETDEDDEEEEEDNKDNDSESSERDSDIPLFTLPGLSSQEPLEDDGNIALIEGAAYPVPDTMEWEQQNQGLGFCADRKATFPILSLFRKMALNGFRWRT